MKDKLINRLKEIDIIHFDSVQLKFAGSSDRYFDIKKAYGDPVARRFIIDALIGMMDEDITCIAADGHGGRRHR